MNQNEELEHICSRCGELESWYESFHAGPSSLTLDDAAMAAKSLSRRFGCDFVVGPQAKEQLTFDVLVESRCVYRIIEECAPSIHFDHCNSSYHYLGEYVESVRGIRIDHAIDQALQYEHINDVGVMLVYKEFAWGFDSCLTIKQEKFRRAQRDVLESYDIPTDDDFSNILDSILHPLFKEYLMRFGGEPALLNVKRTSRHWLKCEITAATPNLLGADAKQFNNHMGEVSFVQDLDAVMKKCVFLAAHRWINDHAVDQMTTDEFSGYMNVFAVQSTEP